MAAFCWQNRAFAPKLLAKTAGKGAAQASLSFREMSDFKALAWIFLPAPARRQAPQAAGGEPPKLPARGVS
jgi:hypothetical protein